MIERAVQLITALSEPGSGASETTPWVAELAGRLRGTGSPPSVLADAIVAALEQAPPAPRARRVLWIIGTSLAAATGAVLGARGLLDLLELLRPFSTSVALLPLGAVPLALASLVLLGRTHAAPRQRHAEALALPLARAGLPVALAVETAGWLAGIDERRAKARAVEAPPDRAGLLLQQAVEALSVPPLLRHAEVELILPGLAAAWAVMTYWITYFAALGAHASAPWFDR